MSDGRTCLGWLSGPRVGQRFDGWVESAVTAGARRDELEVGVIDVISDVLRSIRLNGTCYFEAHLSGAWGFHVVEGTTAIDGRSLLARVDDVGVVRVTESPEAAAPDGVCRAPT
jgi:hypothetical protein